jgi:hypothetical protein
LPDILSTHHNIYFQTSFHDSKKCSGRARGELTEQKKKKKIDFVNNHHVNFVLLKMNSDCEVPKILLLPTEVLIEIFSYVQHRDNIRLICHRFYEVLCLMESYGGKIVIQDERIVNFKIKKVLKAHDIFLQLSDCYQSILNSKRNINGIKVQLSTNPSHNFLKQLEAIILKYDVDIRCLELMAPSTISAIFLPFLLKLISKIPKNNLTMLKLHQLDPILLKEFLNQQKHSLRDLQIIGSITDLSPIKSLMLSHLTLIAPKWKIHKIFESQLNLKYLKVIGDDIANIDEDAFEIISSIKTLQSLDIPLNDVDTLSKEKYFTNLLKLQNLKSFSFRCNASFIFDFCNSSNFPYLEEIDLSSPDELLLENIFDKIDENFPRLKSLSIRSPMALKYLSKVTSVFKNLKSLLIENIFYGYVGITQLNFNQNDINTNLKKLTIINHDRKVLICSNDLLKLLKLIPNLAILVLSGQIDTQKLFKSILQSCKRLKELVIKSPAYHSTTFIMHVIKEYGSRLRLVVLEDFKTAREIESLITFFEDDFAKIQKINSSLILRKLGDIELTDYIS